MNAAFFPRRLCLVGATGLVGRTLIERAVGRTDVRVVGVARREMPLPKDARMEMLLAQPEGWADAIASANAQVLVCALGTTMRKAGSEDAFRAVDRDLVLACAKAARDAGVGHMIAITSVGADPAARPFYLRAKGETERELGRMGFRRLDIVRPGLLRGLRQESRPLERLAMILSPLADLFLHGRRRKFRSMPVAMLADSLFALAQEKAAGRFIHEYDSIRYSAGRTVDSAAMLQCGG